MTDVTDADWSAAEPFRRGFKGRYDREVGYMAEAFARHREASIAPYVEALREARERLGTVAVVAGLVIWEAEVETLIAQIDALLPDTKEEG